MKRMFLLCFVAMSLVSGCLKSDDGDDYYFEILPVESVDMPYEFVLGETYEIHLRYLRPSSCYVFNNFYYQSNLNQRTVAIVNTVYPNRVCETFENQLVDVSFNFMVNSNGTYVFRFWQGQDEYGNDSYYIVEVPVIE